MRLVKIHVSGFKSFVDPTVINITGDLVGIVGPNGCGKSNVIDAVRWVMGESSARNLRGDSMTDVIFNGTDSRKPVGKASVELIFDNEEGKAPGSYSSFAEISVKRTLSRDGASGYLINNSRCRRRDITDMFRGTGLGHRSYSIIEQGMVGRIVEARPDELRAFVEEAAGVSLYKDRRRETETRIRHTRENLERVEDIRNELAAQLRKLQRQSQVARRYQRLRDEERNIHGELLALRYRKHKDMIDSQSIETNEAESHCELVISKQRSIERLIEEALAGQLAAQELVGSIQGEIYSIGADIVTTEQNIEHSRETEYQQRGELDRLQGTLGDLTNQLDNDSKQLDEMEKQLKSLHESRVSQEDALRLSEERLSSSEANIDSWQVKWEEFTQRAAKPVQQQEVERNRIEQLDSRDTDLQERLGRIDEEDQGLLEEEELLDVSALWAETIEHQRGARECGEKIQNEEKVIEATRKEIQGTREKLDEERRLLHEIGGRLKSLKEIQTAALDASDDRSQEWFRERDLYNAPRLAQEVQVASGWETAADVVLGRRLAGLGVGDLDIALSLNSELPGENLFLVESGGVESQDTKGSMLINLMHSPRYDLRPLLAGIYVAETIEDALSIRKTLRDWESVVTRSGVAIGRNWLSAPTSQDLQGGILSREEEIHQLKLDQSNHEQQVTSLKEELHISERRSETAKENQRKFQDESDALQQVISEKRQVHASKKARAVQIHARLDQVRVESDGLIAELSEIEGQLTEARRNLALAEDETGSLERNREGLLDDRTHLTETLSSAREKVRDQRDELHLTDLEIQRLKVSVVSSQVTMERLAVESKRIEERQVELESVLDHGDEPERNNREALEQLLFSRQQAERRLAGSREHYLERESDLRSARTKLLECEQEFSVARGALEKHRLRLNEHAVRLEALTEQINVGKFSIEDALQGLSSEANESVWQEKAERLDEKIQQIGPVNLVAIDEFDDQTKRKEYLDLQHGDLSEALETLEGVIKKIDRETGERFKSTFDALNKGFADFFPQLFGGGNAVLQLTDDDFLRSGVTVMAQPPGKRNSTIHLLSGGEKALTAVALLFALFRLNPAPFCILDEVDAPLDDSNVERYCSTLRSLAARTQLIVITHNKITMESADVLLGVTMGEPGASAIVSVNVKKAISMAAS